MKQGIKRRLTLSYFFMILLTVFIFEAIIIFSLHFYYTDSVEQTLSDQGIVFSNFYDDYLESHKLEDHAQEMLDTYNFLVSTRTQIIGLNGQVLADNYEPSAQWIQDPDVTAAKNGQIGVWKTKQNKEAIMSVSQPLKKNGQAVGIIRFTTSLEPMKHIFYKNVGFLSLIGAVVVAVSAGISYFLAGSIKRPITEITLAAEQMASGRFSTRVHKRQDDEIGKLADTLNYMASEVERHEQLKNEFIASISHELRTPLTSIKGWAVTLQEITDDITTKEGLEIISAESDRLTHLVGDLLDLSSLTSGKIKLTIEQASLVDICRQVVQQMQPRGERQMIQLQLTYESSIPNSSLDKNRMKQVLINLLDNSFKFTPQGGTISVHIGIEDQNIKISVSDTGSGISAEELEWVKDKFYKGHSKSAGSGLGLAICQEILHLHGGEIEIESRQVQGTTVHLFLPL
ncbi:hypothetical protein A8F95_07320 [Bacillus wudalianchiensis]|uniref:histidine kinase n=2 Tax=Pseudobacillus wudalianchiensis TaxID=1743143 RepID=A0A1B9AT76_9BACI|nr:hypothetical protein A8F95_07320 [Bacillus wudalianchiensis]